MFQLLSTVYIVFQPGAGSGPLVQGQGTGIADPGPGIKS